MGVSAGHGRDRHAQPQAVDGSETSQDVSLEATPAQLLGGQAFVAPALAGLDHPEMNEIAAGVLAGLIGMAYAWLALGRKPRR